MKKILLYCAVALTAFACQDELLTPTATEPLEERTPLSRTEINRAVEAHLQTNNTVYDWKEASDHLLWSALTVSEHHVAVGYQPAGFADLRDRIHEIDVNAGAWKQTRDELVTDLRAATERLTGQAISEEELLLVPDDGTLPVLEIKALHPGVVKEFRHRPEVRYFEPSNYEGGELTLRAGSGCSEAPENAINAADFRTISPGAKLPWSYDEANIEQAWAKSQGDGVGIAIIDSGVYPEQANLNGSFASGLSGGRSINQLGFYAPNWWSGATDGPADRCGHGTQMAGLAAAPRTSGGATVGVAYRADLWAYRATSDVIVNSSKEKRGVKDALIDAGNRTGIRIISMSIGDPFSNGTVEDGIDYAYNRGKLITAAAGTSLSWTSWWGVIFPANLSRTVAVTGVRDGLPLQRCNTCHDGSQVDFVAVMQRRTDVDRTSLTLSRYNNEPGYVGGSSAATAQTAGVAALVWSTDITQSRGQVLDRMKAAASNWPVRDGNFGWGTLDAGLAVE